MSTHVVNAPSAELLTLCAEELRRPSAVTAPPLTLTFSPDLTPAEVDTLARLEALARANAGMEQVDMAAIQTRLVNLRTFRQLSQSEFMAQTAAERDRTLFDALTDLTAVVLRMLRD
jgi:hypothetical protein